MPPSVTRKDATREIIAETRERAVRFVREGGEIIRSEQSVRAPVKLGNLRESIQVVEGEEDGVPFSDTGPTAYYGPFVEYGTGIYASNGKGRKTPWTYMSPDGRFHRTSGHPAQPFAEPGYQAAVPKINNLAKEVLNLERK